MFKQHHDLAGAVAGLRVQLAVAQVAVQVFLAAKPPNKLTRFIIVVTALLLQEAKIVEQARTCPLPRPRRTRDRRGLHSVSPAST